MSPNTASSRERLRRYTQQSYVSYETLRENAGVPLEQQISLAQEIISHIRDMQPILSWRRYPTYRQLEAVCDLMWRHFNGRRLVSSNVTSHRQLAFYVRRLYERPLTRDLIPIMGNRLPTDEGVMRTMDFLRLWANFHFPRLLRTIDRIQRDVFAHHSRSPEAGNYEYFATQVENFFFDPALVALDEYGIPLELARKIEFELQPNGDLDTVLERLRNLEVNSLRLTPFEKLLIRQTQETI